MSSTPLTAEAPSPLTPDELILIRHWLKKGRVSVSDARLMLVTIDRLTEQSEARLRGADNLRRELELEHIRATDAEARLHDTTATLSNIQEYNRALLDKVAACEAERDRLAEQSDNLRRELNMESVRVVAAEHDLATAEADLATSERKRASLANDYAMLLEMAEQADTRHADELDRVRAAHDDQLGEHEYWRVLLGQRVQALRDLLVRWVDWFEEEGPDTYSAPILETFIMLPDLRALARPAAVQEGQE